MGLTKLADKCCKCPCAESCDHKRFEAEAYFADLNVDSAAESSVTELAQPILRETVDVIVDGKVVKIYKEKKIYESLYSDFGLRYGG